MIFFNYIALGIFVAIISAGCTTVHPAIQKSFRITIKTPSLKYADQGFIQNDTDNITLEIYSNGISVMKLEIDHSRICNKTGLFGCISKEEFNKRYLSAIYPDDTFENILRGKAIFGGKNIQKTDGGFMQKIIQPKKYDIEYIVSNSFISFHDAISTILINIKENR